MSAATVKNRTWNKTRVQGLLRHRGGSYYARLYVAGKEKWLSLDTTILEIAKAKLDDEKKAIAERDSYLFIHRSLFPTLQSSVRKIPLPSFCG